MKILLVGQAYFREDNGQAVFTVRLARGLRQRGHDVTVLTPLERGGLPEERVDGVRVLRVPTLQLPHNANITLNAGAKVCKRIGQTHFDIVHLQDHYFISRTVWRMAQERRWPVVGTNHFLPQNLSANLPVPAAIKRALEPLFWRHMLNLYHRLDAVSTPTQTAAGILQQQRIKAPVCAISCGVDVERFHPNAHARREMRERLSVVDASPLFLYVGRLDHEKGLRDVVNAFAGLENKEAVLALAGKGSCAIELRQQAKRLGLATQMRFPGYVAAADLPKLYNAADCFIMAGYAELQSIATLEAMASGLPVLAADACALPELVTPGENGLLFTARSEESLTQKWREFLTLRSQWPVFSTASRARAEEHGLMRSVARYEEWYTKAIEKHTA